MAIAYVNGTTGVAGYGTGVAISHVQETTGTVFLTLASVSGINIGDRLYLVGLTTASWLNNFLVQVAAIAGSVIRFIDPSGSHTVASSPETGTAFDADTHTNSLTLSYSSTPGNTLFMVFAVANFTAYGTVVDSNGNTWITAPFGSNVLAYFINSPAITSVTISSPVGYPIAGVLGEYSAAESVLFTYQTVGAASPATITESIGAGNLLLANCLTQTSGSPTVGASSGNLRNTAQFLFDGNGTLGSGWISVSLVDSTSATPASVTDAVTFFGGTAINWSIEAVEVGTISGTWTVTPGSQTILAGLSNGFACTATTGFAGTITPSVLTSMPTGMTAAFAPTTLPSSGGTTALTISTTTSTPPGTYPLVVQAYDGSAYQSATIVVVVTDFEIAISPSSRTPIPSVPTSYTVTVQSFNGYSGFVVLSVTGLPTGASGSFTVNNLPIPVLSGAYVSTLNVVIGSAVTPGTYTLTVTGTDGTSTRTHTCTLVIGGPGWARRWNSI